MYDVVIVGLGVAGTFLSLKLDQKLKVLGIEQNKAILKKFLISGGGKNCNIANLKSPKEIIDLNTCQDGKFLYGALNKFAGKEILQFLDENKINYEIRQADKHRCYLTDGNIAFQSQMLEKMQAKKNLDIHFEETFKRLIIEEDHIVIFTNKARYVSKNIVFALGGASYSNTGSNGFIEKVCDSLELDFKPFYAIGNSLNLQKNIFKSYAGTSLESVKLAVVKNNKVIFEQLGDLMITHNGIGGPVVKRVSHLFEFVEDRPELIISFMKKEVVEFELFKKKHTKLRQCFDRIPKNFRLYLIELAGLKPSDEIYNLNKKQLEKIYEVFSNYKLTGIWTTGITASTAVAGGIDVKQVNAKTMALKKQANIYFIGECLSTGMLTGGYNVTMSLSTSNACAIDINEKNSIINKS